MQSVVIIGASTGIGWATAKLLFERGFRVFGSRGPDVGRLKNAGSDADAAPDDGDPAQADDRQDHRQAAWPDAAGMSDKVRAMLRMLIAAAARPRRRHGDRPQGGLHFA